MVMQMKRMNARETLT